VPGEIYIGGVGVARGYLGKSELTAQRFVDDPFGDKPDARLYRTGDLGQWREDGLLEYLGRNDSQVKIRGYRIEPGEIEAHLTGHAHVKKAVVILREDVPGQKQLVAYVTRCDENGPSVEDLRGHLQATLPEYMVPTAIVMLERLPLTPSGKSDRRALPAPELSAFASQQYEPPRGETERVLAAVWLELLSVERIGRQDNFFDLGGHSLLATRVISRIRERLGVELSVRTLFEAPTIQQLSARVEVEGGASTAEEALWLSNLSRDLRRDIGEMHDDEVLAEIVELTRNSNSDTDGESAPV